MQVIDPVCKMTIEDKDAVATSLYKGTTYYFCSMPCKEDFDKDPESFLGEKAAMPAPILATKITSEMAKDPICGMVIPKDRSIKRVVGGREYYFCSETCVKTFEAPEAELKDMKRRVTIALTGVIALAVFRAALVPRTCRRSDGTYLGPFFISSLVHCRCVALHHHNTDYDFRRQGIFHRCISGDQATDGQYGPPHRTWHINSLSL